MMKTRRLKCICGEVIRLLLKYCIYCASAPSLHRESTDSLICRPEEALTSNLELIFVNGMVHLPHKCNFGR